MNQLVPILLYHSIADESSPRFRTWTVAPTRFAQHVTYLQTHGYTTLTVTELTQTLHTGGDLPQRPVLITFDDGFADFHTTALPILQYYHSVATLYVVTGFVGRTSRWLQAAGEGQRPMLTWSTLRALRASGIECGAHSHTHPELDVLSPPEAWTEIVCSKLELEQQLGESVHTFAYPHGYHTQTTIQLVQQAGFTSACAVKHAISTTHDNPFAFARMFVFADTDTPALAALLEGRARRTPSTYERFPTKIWRVARRLRQRLTPFQVPRNRTPTPDITPYPNYPNSPAPATGDHTPCV